MTNGDGSQAIRLTIPAKPEYITLGRLALTGIARLRSEPLPQEVLGDLKLALTEACTNSVRHAYADGEGLVEILYELHADKLVVEVCDHGEGFTPQPRLGALDEPGGFGLYLVGRLADRWGVERTGGTTVWFVLRRH